LSIRVTGAIDLGPHQRVTCTGSVKALHTSARGASKVRVAIIEGSEFGYSKVRSDMIVCLSVSVRVAM